MKVAKSQYGPRYCNECHKESNGNLYDVEIGEFVSTICQECMKKLRKLIDKQWREYMEEIDNF